MASFRPAATAQDFFKGTNILSIVYELPRAMLGGPKINVWATTSRDATCLVTQVARQGRPLATTVFPTFANRRQQTNMTAGPKDDGRAMALDIKSFATQAAGRSTSVCNALVSQSGPASFLGVETNGGTGGKFGGRALTDDVVDITFGMIFGNSLATFGLATDDGNETPGLTSDHIGVGARQFLTTFPYLGPPI
jgi:hypothetical protein